MVTIISKIYIAYYQLYLFIVVFYRHVFLSLFVIFTAYNNKSCSVINCVCKFVWNSTFFLYRSIAREAWRFSKHTQDPISNKFLRLFPATIKKCECFIIFVIFNTCSTRIFLSVLEILKTLKYHIWRFYLQFIYFPVLIQFTIFSGYYNILINNKQEYSKQDLVIQDYDIASDVCQLPCVTDLLVASRILKNIFYGST